MSMLPPGLVPAVAPVEASQPAQTTMSDNTNGEGKNFAEVLDKASAKQDTTTTGSAEPDTGDEATSSDVVATDTAAAAVEAAVLAANIAVSVVEVTARPVTDGTAVPTAVMDESIAATRAPVLQPATSTVTDGTQVPPPATPEQQVQVTPTTDGDGTTIVPDEAGPAPVAGAPAEVGAQVTGDTATETGPTKLVESLTKAIDNAVATGDTVDKPLANGEAATRGVIDVLSTRSNDVTSAPATSGGDVNDVPAPARQLVQLVAPLRHHGDGDYKLLLQLHPEHLGRVEVAVSLNQGQIAMQMSADNSASRQLLRESMNELRQALTDAGLDAGSLDVGGQDLRDNNTQSGRFAHTQSNVADMGEDEFLARLAPVIDRNLGTSSPATDGLDVHV